MDESKAEENRREIFQAIEEILPLLEDSQLQKTSKGYIPFNIQIFNGKFFGKPVKNFNLTIISTKIAE